jgi:hypothetical protein
MTIPAPGTRPSQHLGIPAGSRLATPAPPGTVKAAAVLAFIWGGLTIISSLISMAAGSLFPDLGSACAENDQSGLCAFVADSGTMLVIVGIALIATAGLVIWGAVVALNGTSAKLLVIAGGIQILVQIVWMIDTGSIAFGTVGVIVPLGIISLMLTSASKTWFQSNGKTTF